MRLKNKVAIITGGASGIGRAIAVGYAKEGAKIVIVDINLEGAEEVVKGIKKNGGEALAVHTDVSEEEQVQSLIDKTVSEFGTLDILVCCAAVKQEASILDTSVEMWDCVHKVNVRGTMLCTQKAAKVMVEKKMARY